MATNKNPYLRYRIINSCFTSKYNRYWTIQALIDKILEHDLRVVKRTIEDDLAAMRFDDRLNYHAPIAYCRTNRGYHYTDVHYTIDAVPLTAEDLDTLTVTMNIIQQYRGVKLVEQFESVVDKLSKVVTHLKRPGTKKILAFEQNPFFKGHEFFDTIYHAADHEQPLRITYKKFAGDEEHEHVFHPYFMKEYQGRWYVLGHSEARHYTVTLALDRITAIKEAAVAYKENKVLKPKEYFQHTMGITTSKGPVEDVELWFSPMMAPYIKTQHIHHTQKTVRDDKDGLVITLKLIPNPELIQRILGYGAEVKVLSPVSLQNKVKEVIGRMVGVYG